MHACGHCAHQNADHLAYCSKCGKRMAGATLLPTLGYGGRGQMAALSATAAVSRTMLASAANGGTGPQTIAMTPSALGRANGASTSKIVWAGQSIGYIYVFMRGKMAAGERRKRLIEERDGADTLLTGAIRDLGSTVLREGVQHPDLTGLLEAIGRAEARREGAIADLAASEHQKVIEEGHLAERETALETEWKAADAASREAEDVLRAATTEQAAAAAKLRRARDDRARLDREAEAAASEPGGESRVAHLKHESDGLLAEARAIEEQTARLDPQLTSLREKSAALRGAAGAARSKLDEAVASRRQSAAAMSASVASHVRERASAEREGADLTEQLGRAALQTRPAVSSLLSVFQRIDRLQETIIDRASALTALERAAAHYDQRKLFTGLGLVAVLLAAGVVALWWSFRR